MNCGYALSLVLSLAVVLAMPHRHSPAKLENRRRRAICLGFLKPKVGTTWISVDSQVAAASVATASSMSLHLQHDLACGQQSHFARDASRAAAAADKISRDVLDSSMKVHRAAHRAKHMISKSAKQVRWTDFETNDTTTASSGAEFFSDAWDDTESEGDDLIVTCLPPPPASSSLWRRQHLYRHWGPS